MLESRDPVRIRFQDEERNKKPVGIHWLQAASVKAVEALHLSWRGLIWPYRLPSLAGALLAVLATFHWGRSLVGRRAAFLGAAMLGSCLLLVVEAHIAKTDAALLASVVAAMGLFGQCYLRPSSFSASNAAAFWLILGVSILIKGPVGPMVALLTGVTLAVADRSAPWWRPLRPLWGVPLMLAVALPWLIAIGIVTEGRFFTQAVGGDMLAKIGAGEEKHWGPPGYYLLTFLIAAFPSAWVVLAALPGAWQDRLNPSTRFLLAWVVPSWLLFEAVQTKLPHYVMPLYPALMLLGAAWALDPLRRMPPRWLRWLGLVALVGVAIGLPLVTLALPLRLSAGVVLSILVALAGAVAMIWLVLRLRNRADWAGAALAGCLLAVPIYFGVLQGVVPNVRLIWMSQRLGYTMLGAAPGVPAERMGVAGYAEPSLVFLLGAKIHLLPSGEAAAQFLAAEPGRVVAVDNHAEVPFRREAERLGLTLKEIGMVTGLNYSRGHFLTMQVYRRAD
jgi:4-amino-4-deoxy-L-arabinose transferase-like glycosyltransferase